jgi:4-hydroxybenzoate polyprenyltransferase
VLLFSILDYIKDETNGVKSIAVIINPRFVHYAGIFITLLASGVFIFLIIQTPGHIFSAIIGLSMSAILFILYLIRSKISPVLCGALTDGILIIPSLLLITQ